MRVKACFPKRKDRLAPQLMRIGSAPALRALFSLRALSALAVVTLAILAAPPVCVAAPGLPTVAAPTTLPAVQTTPLDAEACVAIALRRSPKIGRGRALIAGYKAQLAEVQALYSPRLSALGWAAPMFTVEGSALTRDVTTKWRKPSDWGPYLHVEAMLALPLYTFGRVEAGVDAANARTDVERARLRAVRHVVALEVRKLYFTRLYALSLQPALRVADRQLGAAVRQAQKQYDSGSGAVSQVDVSRLTYAQTVVARYRRQAVDGARLAEAALKLAMGLKPSASVRFAGRRLSRQSPQLGALPELIKAAARHRPEWTQLRKGLRATNSLARAERLANAPVVLLAGQFTGDWAPTRQDTPNPYHQDLYNNLGGGVALALQWNLNPAKTKARVGQAAARRAEVVALRQFAESGIPTDVYRAHQAATQQCELAVVAHRGVKASLRWIAFAGLAYKAGTGPARDLVEGLIASLQAKQAWYGHLRDCHIAHADLRRAVGRDP